MKYYLVAFALALFCTQRSVAQPIVADSVAEFSGVQGQDNWFYGYYATSNDPASFSPMPLFDVTGFPVFGAHWEEAAGQPPWTKLWDSGGHPGGPPFGTEHWAVRRYVSEVSSPVTISGILGDLESNSIGNGFVGRVFVNNTAVHSQVVGEGSSGLTYEINTTLNVGDTVDFAIDPNGSIYTDTTQFTGTISSIPEPQAGLMLMFTLVGCAGRRKLMRLSSTSYLASWLAIGTIPREAIRQP